MAMKRAGNKLDLALDVWRDMPWLTIRQVASLAGTSANALKVMASQQGTTLGILHRKIIETAMTRLKELEAKNAE